MLGEKTLEHILYKILLLDYIKDDYALEFQNASIKIVVGLIFLIVGPLVFEQYSDVYCNVNWLDARLWALLFISVGSIHLYGLFNRKKQLRKNILLVAGILWVWFAISILFAKIISPLAYIYLFFALSSFRCYLCIHVFKRFELHSTVG